MKVLVTLYGSRSQQPGYDIHSSASRTVARSDLTTKKKIAALFGLPSDELAGYLFRLGGDVAAAWRFHIFRVESKVFAHRQ